MSETFPVLFTSSYTWNQSDQCNHGQNNLVWEGRLCFTFYKHTGLSPLRRRWTACFPPRRLGAGVLNNLVTFVLSVWPRPHWSLPQTLTVNLSICRLRLYGKCHVYFYKVFLCSPVLSVIVHVGLSYLLPGNFSPNCAVLKDA